MKRLIPKKPYQLFIVMLCLSLIFGLSSYNLFFLLQANISLVIDYGAMALIDGALIEIIKLCGYGIISLFCYLLFKACEYSFVAQDDDATAGDPDPGNVAIAHYAVIENATGTDQDDILIVNAWNNELRGGIDRYGGGLDDYLDGGGGDDFLYGGAGVDTLIGGAGLTHCISRSSARTLSYI